jgi:hypothetical protein
VHSPLAMPAAMRCATAGCKRGGCVCGAWSVERVTACMRNKTQQTGAGVQQREPDRRQHAWRACNGVQYRHTPRGVQ